MFCVELETVGFSAYTSQKSMKLIQKAEKMMTRDVKPSAKMFRYTVKIALYFHVCICFVFLMALEKSCGQSSPQSNSNFWGGKKKGGLTFCFNDTQIPFHFQARNYKLLWTKALLPKVFRLTYIQYQVYSC